MTKGYLETFGFTNFLVVP